MTRRLVVAALLACALAVAVSVLVASQPGWLVAADEALSQPVADAARASDAVRTVAVALSQLASGWATVVVLVASSIALLRARRRWAVAWVVAVVAVNAPLNAMAKRLVGRERPDYPDLVFDSAGASFPSGHAQAAVVVWVAGVVVVGWSTVIVARSARVASALAVSVVVLAVGWSRVALGLHWPSDVLGGWLVGAAWVLLATLVLTHWGHVRGPRSRPARTHGEADPDPVDAVGGRTSDAAGRPHPSGRLLRGRQHRGPSRPAAP